MSATWSDALRRVATALGRRHRIAEGEDSELTDESGFTLIELMVVLVIMGILMAIAIPTFLGVTSTANDTSTQSNLANVITSAKAIYAKTDAYPTTTKMVAALGKDEPEFSYLATGPSTKQSKLALKTTTTATATTTSFLAAAYMTKTKECWVAADTGSHGVHYGYVKPASGTTVASTACTLATVTFPATSSGTWKTTGTHVVWGKGNNWPLAPNGH